MLSKKVMGLQEDNKCVMKNYYVGLQFEKVLVDSIQCIVSADQTMLIAFVNTLEAKRFTKSTLFNLINTAESISPAC